MKQYPNYIVSNGLSTWQWVHNPNYKGILPISDWLEKKDIGDIVPEKVFECINQYFVIPDIRKNPNKLTFSCHQKSSFVILAQNSTTKFSTICKVQCKSLLLYFNDFRLLQSLWQHGFTPYIQGFYFEDFSWIKRGICGLFFHSFSRSQVAMKKSSNGSFFSFKKRYWLKRSSFEWNVAMFSQVDNLRAKKNMSEGKKEPQIQHRKL